MFLIHYDTGYTLQDNRYPITGFLYIRLRCGNSNNGSSFPCNSVCHSWIPPPYCCTSSGTLFEIDKRKRGKIYEKRKVIVEYVIDLDTREAALTLEDLYKSNEWKDYVIAIKFRSA